MKKYRMFFIGISIFITGMLWAQTNVEVPVPNAVISALDTAELSAMTVKTEVRESEQEKELNVIRFGLDDEIIEMLDDFIKKLRQRMTGFLIMLWKFWKTLLIPAPLP